MVTLVVVLSAAVAAAAGATASPGPSDGLGARATTTLPQRATVVPGRSTRSTTERSTAAPTTETPTTETPTTAPTTEAATTAAPTTVARPGTTVPVLGQRATASDSATTRLNRSVVGLLGLAALISAVTVVFWIRTRPGRGPDDLGGAGHVPADARSVAGHERAPATGPAVGARVAAPATLGAASADDPLHVAPPPELPDDDHGPLEPGSESTTIP